jgi:heat shock protein HspQ
LPVPEAVLTQTAPLALWEICTKYSIERNMTVKQGIAKYQIGQVVRHRVFPFRGVIFDVDPEYANTEEWWNSIPSEVRPLREQPFYHLLAENDETEYVAYVSEQNLVPDESGTPLRHPQIAQIFEAADTGSYRPKAIVAH